MAFKDSFLCLGPEGEGTGLESEGNGLDGVGLGLESEGRGLEGEGIDLDGKSSELASDNFYSVRFSMDLGQGNHV